MGTSEGFINVTCPNYREQVRGGFMSLVHTIGDK